MHVKKLRDNKASAYDIISNEMIKAGFHVMKEILIRFSAQFIKIISHYKMIGYNFNVLQQTACFVVNPIGVGKKCEYDQKIVSNFAFLFNCEPVGRTSDSMPVPTLRFIYW